MIISTGKRARGKDEGQAKLGLDNLIGYID
jgi:hypothetical protein